MARTSAQSFLDLKQIREGVVVLNNNGLRGILMISSLNFALKSDDEQNAIIYQYQSFLNSLDFFCQIVAQSRRLNITGYLEKLKDLEKNQKNELLKVQTVGYHDFIKTLVESGTIMTKTFFVIIPYSIWDAQGGDQKNKKNLLSRPSVPSLTEETFQRCKSQLWQRMEFVAMGLKRCGLQAIPLTTPEIIELFWSLHHPEDAEVGYYPELPSELTQ